MNITIQYPIIDNRVFLRQSNKLPKPYFISPNVDGNEYIRYFGAMKSRHFQEYNYCVGENTFCNAPNALSFRHKPLFYNDKIARPKHSENRFYSDGHILGKFEVKSTYRFHRENISASAQQTFVDLLDLHFSHDVKINDMKSGVKTLPFLNAGAMLANLYLCGSTIYEDVPKTKKYWVQAGQPIIVTEGRIYKIDNICLPPEDANELRLECDSGNGEIYLTLFHYYYNNIPCWIIFKNIDSEEARSAARNLKTLLLRIHAEKQSVIKALEFLSINKENNEVDSQKATAFIKKTLNKLLRERRFNIAQGPIVDAAFAVDDTFSQADYTKLRQALLDISNKYIIDDFDCLFAQIDFNQLCELYRDQIYDDDTSLPIELIRPLKDAIYSKDKLKLKQFLEKHRDIISGCKSSALVDALKWVGMTAFTAIMQ